MRFLVLFLVLASCSAPAFAKSKPVDAVRLISCETPGGLAQGTAFSVQKNRMITANHVLMADAKCHLDGGTIAVVYRDPAGDVAEFKAYLDVLPYSCDGLVPNQTYTAIGYDHGKALESLQVTAIAMPLNGSMPSAPQIDADTLAVVKGNLTHGFSGGPVLDATGNVVGIIIADNPVLGLSFVRSLHDTTICRSNN